MIKRLQILSTAVAALGLTLAAGGATADFYRGKTLTILVGFPAGGGTDVPARLIARHLANHLEGDPEIIVRNMPGGGGVTALNYLAERADRDGLTVMWESWLPLAQVTEMAGVRFNYADLTVVGTTVGAPYLMFARKDLVPGGLTDSADIVQADNLLYAGLQPSTVLDLLGRLALNVLDVDYTYVPGYRGAAPVRAAIQRGEANVTTHALQGYRSGVEPTLVKDGTVVPLWYFQRKDSNGNFVDSPLIPDMPPYLEVYRRARGGEPSGVQWDALQTVSELYGTATHYMWGPPNMDAEAVAALRKAFYATMNDPEAIAEQEKIFGFNFTPVEVETAERVIRQLNEMDPKLVEFFKKMMEG